MVFILETIVGDAAFCQHSNVRPTIFWSYYLKTDKPHGLRWPPEMQQLMHIVLVLPIGSAEAERGFSVMKDIRTNRRLLSSQNLEHLMRLRINGPKDISNFPAFFYAEEWVKSEKMATDNPGRGGQEKRKRPPTTGNDPTIITGPPEEVEDERADYDDSVIVEEELGDRQYLTESQLF